MLDLLATLVTMALVALAVMAELQAIRAQRVMLVIPVTTVQVVTVVMPVEPVIPVTQVLLETQATMVRVAQVELAAMRETPELLATQEIRVITGAEVLAARAAHKALPVALEIMEPHLGFPAVLRVTAVLVVQLEPPVPQVLLRFPKFMGVTEGREVVVLLMAVAAVFLTVLMLVPVVPAVLDLLATEVAVAVAELAVLVQYL
jgi:hypothetical protein